MNKFLYGRHILITGASSGIGRSCAELFARCGYTVYGVSRNCEEGEEVHEAGRIISMRMDVSDEASIIKVVSSIPRLGLVLHCAGFGISGPAEDTPIELVRKQFETNYFGVLRVNAHVLPMLRREARSLVMVVSSIAGRVPIPFQSHYSSSKYALEAYMQALRIEASPYGVRTVLVEPGDTRTAFTARRDSFLSSDSPYAHACGKAVAQMAHDEEHGKAPGTVAHAAMRMVSRKNPPVRYIVGWDYRLLMVLVRLLPDRTVLWLLGRLYHAQDGTSKIQK